MKKKFFVFSLIIGFVFMMTGCSKITTYEEITYDQFQDKINKKESFILFVGSNSCTACDSYKVTLDEVIKDYQVKVYYIDVAKFNIEQSSKFLTQVNFNATPTTVFIKDGKEGSVYNRIRGAATYNKIRESFEKNGYIKVK